MNSIMLRFKGLIECRRTAAACVTLIGKTERGERAYVTLGTAAPGDLPPRIEDGVVELLDRGRCRVSMPGREWLLDVPRVFVHRDACEEFYAALPPRPVRLVKRIFFRVMLTVAGSRAGRWWLAE